MDTSLAIVILNYNGKHHLERYLPSVLQYSKNIPVYIADNASTDDSISFIQEHFTDVNIIEQKRNFGFAGGYNVALEQLNGQFDYYLLLNSDVEVSENWLIPLLRSMENPKIAGCQPKVLSHGEKTKFEHAGAAGGYLDHNYYPFCRGRIFNETEKDTQQYDGEAEVFWTSGACMLIRSELFHKAGGFDELFFAHMEEIDLCWRIKKLGYQFKIIPSSEVYHVGGGTLAYLSPKKTYLNFRNSLYMLTKNHVGWLFPKLFYRMLLDGIAAMMFLFSGKPRHFWAVFRAHIDFYKHIGTMVKKRKELKKIQTDFNATGLYRGSILWAKYFKRIHSFSNLNMRLFD